MIADVVNRELCQQQEKKGAVGGIWESKIACADVEARIWTESEHGQCACC